MRWLCASMVLLLAGTVVSDDRVFEKDVIQTSAGDLTITFIGHGSLMLEFQNKVLHIDPYGKLADYTKLPPADVILLTHHHPDHLDSAALKAVQKESSRLILTRICANSVSGGITMQNRDQKTIDGIGIEAVPAYNLVHKRPNGEPFHPKGDGNGYVLTFGDTRVYVAGDTENVPEMKALKAIDIAFLPMNLPYTMTPEMVADAARSFRPKVLYPYHYGTTETQALVNLLKDQPDIEVRVRRME